MGYRRLENRWLRRFRLRRRGDALAFRRWRLRSVVGVSRGLARDGGPTSCGPRQVALCQTAPVEPQPRLLAGGGGQVGTRCAGEQRPIRGGGKQRHGADADHASEYDQGGGSYETQMRGHGPCSFGNGRPPRHHPGQRTTALWRYYVRWRRRFPAEIETVFNGSHFSLKPQCSHAAGSGPGGGAGAAAVPRPSAQGPWTVGQDYRRFRSRPRSLEPRSASRAGQSPAP